MPSTEPTSESKSSHSMVAAETAPLHRFEWLGVLVVIAFCVVPDIRNAFQGWGQPVAIRMSTSEIMIAILVRSTKVVIVVFLVMTVLKTRWDSIGFRPVGWRDLRWAIGIWLAGSAAFYLVQVLLSFADVQSTDVFVAVDPPSQASEFGLLLVGSLANGLAEEVVIRGYLLTRLERLLHSTWAAVVITSVMFASYHFYQGIVPMTGILALGLVYAAAFCFLRRIWPLIFAHAIADVTSFL